MDSPAEPAVCTMLFSRMVASRKPSFEKKPEERDRNDRDRNRRAHRETDLKDKIKRRGAEDDAEQCADDERQRRQLAHSGAGRDVRFEIRRERILRLVPDDVRELVGRISQIDLCHSDLSVPEQWPNDLRASRRPPRPHSQNPSIKQERYDCESDAANNSAREFESRADQCQRRVLAGEDDDCRNHHTDNAFADDQAGREQHAELLGGLRLGTAVCALLKEPSSNRADDNHQRALRSADKSRGPLPTVERACVLSCARGSRPEE